VELAIKMRSSFGRVQDENEGSWCISGVSDIWARRAYVHIYFSVIKVTPLTMLRTPLDTPQTRF
jgi:hypothetical protein